MQRCISSDQFLQGVVMRSSVVLVVAICLISISIAAAQSDVKPTATAKAAGTGEPVAIINTTVGKMHCTLFPDKAPIGVANFIGLANGTKDWKTVKGVTKHGVPLYDGTIFHRVIPNFMIQGGDPAGDGTGDPGYKFKNEVSSDLTFDRPGRLAYANAGPNTNGSQFFITEVATPHLNGGYTIFGQCDDATVELVKQIARMATDPQNNRPFRPVKIIHITIENGGQAVHHGPVAKPGASKPQTSSN
jgi:peptidyl-prolyl cis-trans isomerase A (cyclophilin A)